MVAELKRLLISLKAGFGSPRCVKLGSRIIEHTNIDFLVNKFVYVISKCKKIVIDIECD